MGVLLPQLYTYNTHYPNDAAWMKALVYSLAILEVLQTCLVTADAFHWFVFGYGNMSRLDDTFLNSWDVPLLDAVVALVAQLFYCWRILILRPKSYIILGSIILVAIAQCVAGIVVAVQAHNLGKLSLIGENSIFPYIWLSGSALADIMITATLAWTLLMASPKKGVSQRSRKIITRIVMITAETNSLTAGVAIIALIIFVAVPSHSALVVPPTAIMGKLYTNCLVAVLNHRSPERDELGNTVTGSRSESHSMQLNSRSQWQTTSRRGGARGGPRLHESAKGNNAGAFPINISVVQDVEVEDDFKGQSSVMAITQPVSGRQHRSPNTPDSWETEDGPTEVHTTLGVDGQRLIVHLCCRYPAWRTDTILMASARPAMVQQRTRSAGVLLHSVTSYGYKFFLRSTAYHRNVYFHL
ncbi:hypothetical protein EXIGLDRAFT_610004 [Exidia glandulosa HHB12029]|uniref:DUF6534 domain-containing protein n=1 Tax=Exidia glandulosa HHB12029 TaxID=1314781 RepID=A0A165K799_EXIGL|nr:hypothetical protein EXIGLDRAFT_610004 [Exidia glandulosa HHB12029]